MKSFLVLLALLGVCFGRRVNDEMTPAKFSKWHEMFVWHNPENWRAHETKLNALCNKMHQKFATSEDTDETERPGLKHVEEVLTCCDLGPGDDRHKCFVEMQRKYVNFCCTDRAMAEGNQCCQKKGATRQACFHADPPTNAQCTPAYEFGDDYRSQTLQTEDEQEEIVSQSVVDAINAAKVRSWTFGRRTTEAPTDNSNSQYEDTETTNDNEEDDIMTVDGLRNYLGEDGMTCVSQMIYPDIPSSIGDIDFQTELEEAEDTNCCGPCCKAGAAIGKKELKPHSCPYIQCRQLWTQFFKNHRKCIKRPKCCAFGFVSCCEHQYHKDQEMAGRIDEPIVRVQLEPMVPETD